MGATETDKFMAAMAALGEDSEFWRRWSVDVAEVTAFTATSIREVAIQAARRGLRPSGVGTPDKQFYDLRARMFLDRATEAIESTAKPGQWALAWLDRFSGEMAVLETSGDVFEAGDFSDHEVGPEPASEGYGLFVWRGRAWWHGKVLRLDGEWSKVSREDVARIAHRCDGDHPEPACVSPECWRRDPPGPAIEEGPPADVLEFSHRWYDGNPLDDRERERLLGWVRGRLRAMGDGCESRDQVIAEELGLPSWRSGGLAHRLCELARRPT